jgi:PBP1b-binding outer membrane lipoprotein LpoB
MKYPIAALLLSLALTGCASTESDTIAPTAEPAAETEATTEAVQPECAPGAEDCDQGGTDFRPPQRTQ